MTKICDLGLSMVGMILLKADRKKTERKKASKVEKSKKEENRKRWMDGWAHTRIDEWMDEQTYRPTDRRTDRYYAFCEYAMFILYSIYG